MHLHLFQHVVFDANQADSLEQTDLLASSQFNSLESVPTPLPSIDLSPYHVEANTPLPITSEVHSVSDTESARMEKEQEHQDNQVLKISCAAHLIC